MGEAIDGTEGFEEPSQQQSNLDIKNTVSDYAACRQSQPERSDLGDPRPEHNLRTMEKAPPDLIAFVKLKEFEKFYSYIDEKHAEVKRSFFEKAKFWDRRWDVFYIYPPEDIQHTAILLLPLDQASHFLRTINAHLDISIALPSQVEASGLIMSAPDNGAPRPRYIAKCENPASAPSVKIAIPGRGWRPQNEPPNHVEPSEEAMRDFRAQMEALALTDLRKRERDKVKRKTQRHLQQKAKACEIMRTQRYLGLRKKNADIGYGGQAGQNVSSQDSSSELDLEMATPYPQEGSVVFICIDIEAYEFPPNPITEVGIATFDTADISGFAPGLNGHNWFRRIRARHFLVEEFRYLENKVHCIGNRDGFVFGTTELVRHRDLKRKIFECFKPPFSKSNAVTLVDLVDPKVKRNIIFVGHDVKQDIDYLKKLDVHLCDIEEIKDVIDSSNMWRALRRAENKTGLGNVLLGLNLVGTNLHNGGNDAVYTLQAIIATAIKAEVDKDILNDQHAAELEKKIEEAMDHQSQLLMKQKEGWDLGEDSDGGDAEDPWVAFKPKAWTQQPPKPKIIDPLRGAWTPDLARNLPGADRNAGQPIAHHPTQRRGNIMAANSWRPGIQAMRDEDIE